MKLKFILRASALATLAIATSFATSSILARGGPPKRKPTVSKTADSSAVAKSQAPRPVVTTTESTGNTQAIPPGLRPAHVTSSYSADKAMVVAQDGRQVTMSAVPTLFSENESPPFFWMVRVVDSATSRTQYEKKYGDQIFTVLPNQTIHPKFEETLTLPAGRYKLFVMLIGILPGVDPESVNIGAASARPVTLSWLKEIKID